MVQVCLTTSAKAPPPSPRDRNVARTRTLGRSRHDLYFALALTFVSFFSFVFKKAAFNASTRSPSAAPASMASWVSRPASSSSRTTSPSFPFPNRSRASSHDPPPSACAPAWAATFPSSTWTAMAAAPRQLFEESTNPPQTRKKKDSYRCEFPYPPTRAPSSFVCFNVSSDLDGKRPRHGTGVHSAPSLLGFGTGVGVWLTLTFLQRRFFSWCCFARPCSLFV